MNCTTYQTLPEIWINGERADHLTRFSYDDARKTMELELMRPNGQAPQAAPTEIMMQLGTELVRMKTTVRASSYQASAGEPLIHRLTLDVEGWHSEKLSKPETSEFDGTIHLPYLPKPIQGSEQPPARRPWDNRAPSSQSIQDEEDFDFPMSDPTPVYGISGLLGYTRPEPMMKISNFRLPPLPELQFNCCPKR